jgi:hypothetical protein
MRWLITFVLLILVVVGGAVLFFPDRALSGVGLWHAPPPASESVTVLDAMAADKVRKLELTRPGQQPLTLVRGPAGRWTQPGEWPVREREVSELVDAVTSLHTRYQPQPLGDDPAEFGLADADKPYTAKVEADGKTTTLVFGRAKNGATYVRVDNADKVLRVGADVFQVISRPPDEYRRRQLFPDAPRLKFIDESAVGTAVQAVPGDLIKEVRVTGPDGAYTLKRVAPNPLPRRDPDRSTSGPTVFPTQMADSWELLVNKGEGMPPVRDRADPVKLKTALAAVPDLWADGFPNKTKDGQPLTDTATGLDKPERTLTLMPDGGKPVTLKIGKVARTVERKEPGPPPPPTSPFPMPPMEREVKDTFHYARFEDNPLVFEVKADKFADLFAKPDVLRDATLARFTADEAQMVEVTIPAKPTDPAAAVGGPAVVVAAKPEPTVVTLTKKKGNPFALRDDDRNDRWYVGDRLAESGKVTELLDALSKLEAKTPTDRLDEAKPELPVGFDPLGGLTVKVMAQAKTVEGDTLPPSRTYTFQFTARNPATKKLAVSVSGWPRVNLVDDAVFAQVDRGPLAYRSRRLFDTAEATLNQVVVAKVDGSTFELTSEPKVGGGTEWKLTKPLAVDLDSSKASRLTADLSGLEAAEYVDDAPRPDKLAGEYGLTRPRFVLDLGFKGTGAKPQKLEIGATRPGKAEAFARLNGGGVFSIAQSVVDSLDKGALDLLPLQLWTATPEQVTVVGIERGGEKYTLTKDGEKWKVGGPFDATAGAGDVLQLATSVAALKADKYDALTADPTKHGLDQPALKLSVTAKEKKPGEEEKPVTRTVLVGKPADGAPPPPAAPGQPPVGPGRYARFADGPNTAVFIIPNTTFAAADKPALAWLDRTLLTLDPTKLTKVVVAGSDTVTLTKGDKDTQWMADGFTADRQAVGNLVFTAASLPVARLAAYGSAVKWEEYGLDKPAFTVTVSTGGEKPETHTIKLGKEEPSGERYVRVDDGPAVGVVNGTSSGALARGKLELADRTLLAFDPTQLTGVIRKKGDEEFELAQGIGWEVVKPAKFKADTVTVDELVDQLSRLRAVKVAAIDPTDLKPFGLDTPAAEVSLAVGADKPKTLVVQIGKPVEEAKPTGDRFVRVDKAGPVKVLAGSLANRLLADPIKFKDKALAKFVDADKVTIARGDRKTTFAKVDGTWKMTEPTAADAEQADLDDLVNTAAKLRADELAAEKPTDLKPFGLDTPVATVTFFSGDKEVLGVQIGKYDGDTKRAFGKVAGGEAVAVFDTGVSTKLLGEFRKRTVWSGVDAAQAQVLTVSAGSATFTLRKTGATWVDPAKPDDPVDTTKVTDTLAALAGLKAERYVADKDADLKLYGLDKPSRVIVVTQQTGEAKTLHLGGEVGGTNGKQVYAKVDDPARTDVFVLSEADTAKLTRDKSGYGKK